MSAAIRIPKKGASRKIAESLKKLGEQRPPQDLVDKINKGNKKRVASPWSPDPKDLDV